MFGIRVSHVRVGQVWLYKRADDNVRAVVHVITRIDKDDGGDICESTSVFTRDGEPHQRVTLSGKDCGGRGVKAMLDGSDRAGTWTLLYDPVTPVDPRVTYV